MWLSVAKPNSENNSPGRTIQSCNLAKFMKNPTQTLVKAIYKYTKSQIKSRTSNSTQKYCNTEKIAPWKGLHLGAFLMVFVLIPRLLHHVLRPTSVTRS